MIDKVKVEYAPRLGQVLQVTVKDPPELPTLYNVKGSRTRSGPPGYSI